MSRLYFTYWMSDASKRKHFNFLNTGYWMIEQVKAWRAFQAVLYLAHNPEGEEAGAQMRLLLDSVVWHSQVPTILSKDKVATENKIAGVIHGNFLDVGSVSRMVSQNRGACSWTTDGGVEMAFNNFRVSKIEEMFPYMGDGFEADAAPAPGR